MDIKEDYQKFKELGFEVLLTEINQEKEKLRKREYLFEILNRMNILDTAIKNGFFAKNHHEYISFKQKQDYETGYYLDDIVFLDINNKEIPKFRDKDGEYTEEISFIKNLLGPHYLNLEYDLMNSELLRKHVVLKLDNNLVPTLKKLLLNNELLSIISYLEIEDTILVKDSTLKLNKKIKV